MGQPSPKNTRIATLPVIADTGCQSCLAGAKVLRRIGLEATELVPVTMKMNAANDKGIKILGATFLHLSGTDDTGRVFKTRQMTYITDSSDKFFLSKEACRALGVISEDFPRIGEYSGPSTNPHQLDSTNNKKQQGGVIFAKRQGGVIFAQRQGGVLLD